MKTRQNFELGLEAPTTVAKHSADRSSTRFEQSCIGYAGQSYFERLRMVTRTME
jgi:hypothetical protein